MKVLLRSDVRGVGRRGDIVEVKAGFARNFLVPTGQAIEASDTLEAQSTWMRRARDVKDAQSREAAETQKALIEGASLVISARAGSTGRLFGSVTEADVVNAIRTATGVSLDRGAIHMDEHLKEIGAASVTATLFEDVVAMVTLEVVAL